MLDRDETNTMSEDTHWRPNRLGGEEDEDQSRDGWTVSTFPITPICLFSTIDGVHVKRHGV